MFANITNTMIQTALKAGGFYTGDLDGDFGPLSRAARDAALKADGVDLTGWPHSRLMAGARQWFLFKAGFDPMGLDGIPGAKSEKAARDYFAANGAKLSSLVTGKGRGIKLIAIHCTATREGQDIDAATIRKWHKRQGWNDIGYHFVIGLDGEVERGRAENVPGAHIGGHNTGSIGVVYVGGLDRQGAAKDTRTDAQKAAMEQLVRDLTEAYPKAEVKGHRDLSPDKDGDGVVEPHEWLKMCPCFDVPKWWKEVNK